MQYQTFEDFQKSGRYVENLQAALPEQDLDTAEPGRIYGDHYFIIDTKNWEPAYKLGNWFLLLGNIQELSDNLEVLERKLYKHIDC